MRINRHVIERYLWVLTNGVAASATDPMGELDAYDREIALMVSLARGAGEEELLRISIDSLLANPRGRIGQFNGQVYGFREDQMEELLAYAFARAWPDAERSPPGEGIDLEFVPMSEEEWRVLQQG